MIKILTQTFYDPKIILNKIKVAWNPAFRTDILGGHYLLDYDPENKELKPLIYDEKRKDAFNRRAWELTGHFPVATFEYAVDLNKYANRKKADSRIMLLINDHQFPAGLMAEKVKIAELRTRYYRANQIPPAFEDILMKNELQKNKVLLENKDSFRFPVPEDEKSFLFSEYKYRKKFDRSLKKKLLEYDEFFYAKERSNGKTDIYLKNYPLHHTCLTEGGNCGCSGEVMEFIHQRYIRDGMRNFVLFVPASCNNAVSTGLIAIAIYLKKALGAKDFRAILVSDLPCENPVNKFYNGITYQEISYE